MINEKLLRIETIKEIWTGLKKAINNLNISKLKPAINCFLIRFLNLVLKTTNEVKIFTVSDFTDNNSIILSNKTKQPLPFVNIFIENTYQGTTSNDEGDFELLLSQTNNYTIVFQYLGFKTYKKTINAASLPIELDVIMEEEVVSLKEVVINVDDNPANKIVRNTIKNRKKNLSKYDAFQADFYSRGLIRIKNAPEKLLGQDIGDLGGGLDSTRSGIIYLSETISKIEYKKPDLLKERIVASKVSGDNNGFSFNNANDVNYNFYNNTIEIQNQLISPISDYAFNYYRYSLEGDFYDDYGNLVNKIKVIPKRKNDRIFSGYIYIVEDDWSIYALDLVVTGKQAKIPAADSIKLKQSFSYSKSDKLWALISQSIDFSYSILGIEGDGRFTAVYSNYNFNPEFKKRTFTRELLAFEDEANKKDSLYWNKLRPVPLSQEEISDYLKKDSIQIVRESRSYLDSIDRVRNKFKIHYLVTGYNFTNSYKDWTIGISAPLLTFTYNTVQGHNGNVNFNFRKNYDEYRRYLEFTLKNSFGLSEKRYRINGSIRYKFNNISKPYITLSGGTSLEQFNSAEPISKRVNAFSTLFFEDNYMKLYDKSFAQLDFSQELFNGFRLYSSLSFERRKPLFNNSNWSITDEPDDFLTSNNPLDETAFGIAPFDEHNIFKLNLTGRIRFGQNYFSYPGSKVTINNNKYPTVFLSYRKGFGSSNPNYHFNQIQARLTQNFDLSNKGSFAYNLKAGGFIDTEEPAFMDYHHFNGNQTHVGPSNYLDKFNNLAYYTYSTNKSYAELHAEHNFNGYIMNKIPLLKKLNFNLILGAHALSVENQQPYQEYTIGLSNIGWGKFRILRVDYLRSYKSGFINDILVFGVSL